MWVQTGLPCSWDESNRATNVRNLVVKKRTQGKVGQQQKKSHIGQELTENENEKQATEIALTALKNGKTSQNQQNANTSCEPAQHYQHSVKSRKTDGT